MIENAVDMYKPKLLQQMVPLASPQRKRVGVAAPTFDPQIHANPIRSVTL